MAAKPFLTVLLSEFSVASKPSSVWPSLKSLPTCQHAHLTWLQPPQEGSPRWRLGAERRGEVSTTCQHTPPSPLNPRFPVRFRAKREQLKRCQGLHPESQGQNLALTALCVPYSLDGSCSESLLSSSRMLASCSQRWLPGGRCEDPRPHVCVCVMRLFLYFPAA